MRRAGLLLAFGLWTFVCACGRPGDDGERYGVSVPYDLDTLDPGARNRLSDFSLLSNLYEPLVVTDANLSVRPALALRWNNPDPLTWRFELRPGVLFHDGSPLGAGDVVWSFERLRGTPGLEMGGHVAGVRSVRALDGGEVEVRTAAPVGILLNKLRFVLIVRRGEDFPVLSGRVNGTGPYRLSDWKRGESMLLERNEAYWGPRPALAAVRFLLNRSPASALEDLRSGRSRFVQSSSKATEAALARDPSVALRRNSSVSVKFLFFDVASERSPDVPGERNPFRDVRVRRAVSLAVDRDELVRRLSVPAAPASQLVPPFIFGHDPSRRSLRHDPEEARRLLAEAGWEGGFDVRFPARGLFSEAAQIVADMLERVGIRARVAPLPETDWFRAMGAREFAMTISRFGCPTGDASDLLENLLHTRTPDGLAGVANYLGYSDAEFDRLVALAARTLEMPQRRQILAEATGRVMEDLPVVPLYVDQDLYAFRAGVEWKPRNDNFLIASEIALSR